MPIATTLIQTAVRSLALACLACNSVATVPPQDSPRKLIERAAYADEHEHDLDAAVELYAKAAKAAADAGDAATAKEAAAARERILVRQGKSQAPAASKEDEELVTQRAAMILGALSRSPGELKGAAEQVAIFGARVVPWLEQMLAGTRAVRMVDGVDAAVANPQLAARTLVEIDTPESWAALERGFASPDPTVRLAIVTALPQTGHLEVARRASLDPVPAVREAAIIRLTNSADAKQADVLETAARNDSSRAAEWLVNYSPERALALAVDRAASSNARKTVLEVLKRRSSLPPKLDVLRQLLAIGTAGDDASLHASALAVVNAQLWSWQQNNRLEPLREDAARLVAEQLEHEYSPDLLGALGISGSAATVKSIAAQLPKVAAQPDERNLRAIETAVANANGPSNAERFQAWLDFYRAVPADFPKSQNSSNKLLEQVSYKLSAASTDAPLDAIARGAAGLQGEAKDRYTAVLVARMEGEARKVSAKNGGVNWPTAGSFDKALLPVALEVLSTGIERYVGDVMTTLAGIGDVQQIRPILDFVEGRSGSAGSESTHAIDQLARVDPKAAAAIFTARIEPWLTSATPSAGQLSAMRLVAELPDEAALQVIRTAWPKASSEQAKSTLAGVLVRSVNGDAATAFLLEHYRELPAQDVQTRQEAIQRFGKELYEPAIAVLGEALKDQNEQVRLFARTASQAFKTQREALEEFAAWTNASKEQRDSIAELAKLLESSNKDVVLGAIKALGAVKARTALPALVKLLERNDADLKAAVQDAIAKIGAP